MTTKSLMKQIEDRDLAWRAVWDLCLERGMVPDGALSQWENISLFIRTRTEPWYVKVWRMLKP